MKFERFWACADSSQTRDATDPENDTSMTLHHWQKLCRTWTTDSGLLACAEAGGAEGWSACWLIPVAPSISPTVASTALLHRSSESNATILKRWSTVVAKHSSSSAKTSLNLKDWTQLIIQGTSCELLRRWIPSCWIEYGFESSLKVNCSEISCNVKWNVYLAMEIPDCVSFISGQNSDDRVRSCEPNVFLA